MSVGVFRGHTIDLGYHRALFVQETFYTYVNKKCNRRILIRVGKLIPGSLLPGLFFFRALLTNKEETRVFIRPDPFKEQPYLNDRKSTICTFLSASNMTLSFFVRIVSVYVFVNDVDM
jgi:hypothetical protein